MLLGSLYIYLVTVYLIYICYILKQYVFHLQVKVQGQNEEMLHAACQQFLGKSEQEIRNVALETLVRLKRIKIKNWKEHMFFFWSFFFS